MSRFRFEIPTEAQALDFLEGRRKYGMYQVEMYQDTIKAQRALVPVTTPAEREAVREYLNDKKWGDTA